MYCTTMCAVISWVEKVSGCVDFCPIRSLCRILLCVFVTGLHHSPDNRLCLRMASLIRSYVTSSVQLTKAFLVMLGSVPEEAKRIILNNHVFFFLLPWEINHFCGFLKWHLSRVHEGPRSGRCVCRPAWCRCSDGPHRPGSSGLGIEPWPHLWAVQRTLPWHP